MRSPPGRQRGVALVLVVWAGVLITVIATSFIVERRVEMQVIHNSESMARAKAAADAGVHRGLVELYRTGAQEAWKRDGTPHEWSLDGIPVRIELRDESAKIDLNSASDPLLRGLLVQSGLAEEEATRLLEAILDWRDPDILKRPNGAEEGDYRAAGLAHRPANAPFQAIEELQLVLGMRPDLYRRLAPSITVFSRQPGINPQLASREVLMALPGVTAEGVDEYIARREYARAQGQPLPFFPQAAGFAAGGGMVATVISHARLEDGTAFIREAIALMRPVARRPVTFVAWRELAAPVEAPATAGPTEGAR